MCVNYIIISNYIQVITGTWRIFQRRRGDAKGGFLFASLCHVLIISLYMNKEFEIYKPDLSTSCQLPLFTTAVAAGFPSPAEDYIEKKLDLNELVISNSNATFFVKVTGESMRNAGIQSGDILVVDRSIEPSNGKIVVAILNGEFTVKRIRIQGSTITLLPENNSFPDIPITAESDFQVWGVVTYVIHKAG